MKHLKRSLALAFLSLSILVLSSCNKDNTTLIENLNLEHELEFGGVYFEITIDDFNSKGFDYGDSISLEFSNGYKILDLPYYNGYYVDAGESLLVGYPGYEYIKLAINYGDDYWDIIGLNDNDTASIKLNEKAKYKDIQDTMNIQYKDDRTLYDSDIMFANYRSLNNIGNIKDNILFRSASPCDNKHNRAHYVDTLIENDNVNFIMNLSDTKEKIEGYIQKEDFNSPYFLSLYRKNSILFTASNDEKIIPLAMNMNYKSIEFRNKVSLGFRQFLEIDGPYLIHCQEGKDRTGFVCIVIEALCGGTYKEIVDDYMLTYYNYYRITEESDSLRYRIIKERNVDAMLRFLVGDDEIKLDEVDFSPYIKTYLINGGMTNNEVETLISILSK